MWDTLEEFISSNYMGLIHIRNRTAGGPTYYDIQSFDIPVYWDRYECSNGSFYLAAMAPTEKTLFQGEVCRNYRGIELTYTTVRKPMRDALAIDTRTAQGIIAVSLLRKYMCPTSYDWLETLLDSYPDHVVEFSVFDCYWGTIPHMNTVFWECRNY